MSSGFLAPAYSKPVDPNLLSEAAQSSALSPADSPWKYAVERYNSALIGGSKTTSITGSGGLEEFIKSTKQAQLTAQKTRSKALQKINAIIDRVSYYKGPIDSLTQTSQEAMFAWGSLKFLMEIVSSEKKVSDKLADAITDVVGIFGRCEIYARLFASSKRVIEGIGILYGDVLNLLVGATKYYGKSSVKRFLVASTTPFEIKFAPIVADIGKHASDVQQEVNAAFLDNQKEESDLQRTFRTEQQAVQTDQRKRDVTLWLHPIDASSDLQKLRKDRTLDTCRWLQKKEVFESWKNGTTSRILWVSGIPGSGKTFLASYIVDQLKPQTEETDAAPPIFFFCSSRSDNRRASTHILRSLVHQLSTQRPDLWEIVDKAYSKSTSPVADVFEELWELFLAMLRATKHALCVIDGLDECQNHEEDGTLERSVFAQRLLALCDDPGFSMKVLLTSRNEPDLASTFRGNKYVRTLSITTEDVELDIQAFISSKVSTDENLQSLPSETQAVIITTLSGNVSGMFILAKLMLQLLEEADSPEAIKVTLQKLPRKLVHLYDRILGDIADRLSESDVLRDIGGFTLIWVLYSARQLTITELAEARQIVPGCQELVNKRKPFSLVSFRRLIQKACSPLVEVRDDGLLQLAHHTTKEYLLSKATEVFKITQPLAAFQIDVDGDVDPNAILFEHCLTYLTNSAFKGPLLGITKRFKNKDQAAIRVAHPLLEYASTNWLIHAQNSYSDHFVKIRQFLVSHNVVSWIEAILVEAGVPHLATMGDLVQSRISNQSVANQDAKWITEWFSKLHRTIFTWGGTLSETPSEIHHLYLPGLLPEINPNVKLQRMTKLLYPTDWRPQLKPIRRGDTFVVRKPYVFAFESNRKPSPRSLDPVIRYHWVSMQKMGQVPAAKWNGRSQVVTQIQISESGRYIFVVWLSFSSLTTHVWSISEDGFDPLPWSDAGQINHVQAEYEGVPGIPYSRFYRYRGRGFYNSHRCAAFSRDEQYVYTPTGRYELLTGSKTSVPLCCTDTEVRCASWSYFGDRIACIRDGKGVEVYEQDGKLVGRLYEEHLARATIKDFSQSARYVLLETETRFFNLYDVDSSTVSDLSLPRITAPFGDFLVEGELTESATITLSFSPCEKYILCVIDNSSYMLPSFLLVWSLENRTITNSQAFPPLSKTSPIYASFDREDSTVIHVLVKNTNSSHGTGFVEYLLTDDWSSSKNYGESWRDWKADVGVSPQGGFVHQKSWARHDYNVRDEDIEPFVDFFLWDLETAPPLFRGRAKIPRCFEGWTDGYSQTNGYWDNGLIASKEVSKFLVGGRVFEYPSRSECEETSVDLEGNISLLSPATGFLFEPTLSQEFSADSAWSRLVKNEKTDPTTEEGWERIKSHAYHCFLSPDESMACFYSSKVYVCVMDVNTGELLWFRQFEGDVSNYIVGKPLFHPNRRILAWKEQLGGDGDSAYEMEECGIWVVEMKSVDSEPVKLDHGVHGSSNYLFHPTRDELYVCCIGPKVLRVVCFSIPTTQICSKSLPSLLWHMRVLHPLPLPSPEPTGLDPDLGHLDPRMVLYNSEIHFLFNSGYKIFLAKLEPDGEIKWKKIGSRPGPPRVANVYLCPGWKENKEKQGRIDVICSGQDEVERLVVINSWIEEDDWDETVKAEKESCGQCEKLGK